MVLVNVLLPTFRMVPPVSAHQEPHNIIVFVTLVCSTVRNVNKIMYVHNVLITLLSAATHVHAPIHHSKSATTPAHAHH